MLPSDFACQVKGVSCLQSDVHDQRLDEQHECEDAPQDEHHLHAGWREGAQRASLPHTQRKRPSARLGSVQTIV